MGEGVIAKTGFPGWLNRDGLIRGFVAHNEAVKNAIPANRWLVDEVQEGWALLCQFFAVPVPADGPHGPTIAQNSGTA
jgi:Sulfotransferase domain